MKRLIVFSFLLLTTLVQSQVNILANGLNSGITNLVVFQNKIYFTSFSNKKIYQMPIIGSNSNVVSEYMTLPEKPIQLILDNYDLYIATEQTNKIYKKDLRNPLSDLIQIASISGTMAIFNNDLYVGQYTDSKILKLDLNSGIQTDYLTGYKPNYFALQGSNLYFTSNFTNKLYRVNLLNNQLSTELENLNYIAGITIKDDICYFCESQTNVISYYDLESQKYLNQINLNANSWPNGITISDNVIYFISTVSGQISSISLSSLGIKTFEKENFSLYPNPSSDYITISSLQKFKKFCIYNELGTIIKNGELNSEMIPIQDLSNGVYLLVLDNQVSRFIKH